MLCKPYASTIRLRAYPVQVLHLFKWQYNGMVLKLLIVIAIVFILLLIAEYLWKIRRYRTEFTRKFVHITVGTFVAFWPWFLSWTQIGILAGAFLAVIIISRTLTVFGSIHLIGRKTAGEIFFALCIGLTALVTQNRYIFMAAILHLSIADGFAAIVGTKYGKRFSYRILGQPKSLAGSATFWLSSVAIVLSYALITHTATLPVIIYLPLLATIIENIGIRGSDNLLVPVVVALVLRLS